MDSKGEELESELQHTLGHVRCPACEALRKFAVMQSLDELSFNEAWPFWFVEKEQTIGQKTRQLYNEYRKTLSKFFGQLRLSDIHLGHITAYRKERLTLGRGPTLINHEVDALRQLLRHAGCWGQETTNHYKQLKVQRSTIGQRPTDEEIIWLFQCAKRNPRWKVAHLAAVVMVQTAAGPEEVLAIKLGHIDWGGESLHIHGTKTDVRPRDIPMTKDCYFALKELELIARAKGASAREHYLFPHKGTRENPGADPTRHQLEIRNAWKGLCRLAAKKYPRLAHLRRKDLRHFALSAIYENPKIDEPTAKIIAGHGPGSRMLAEVYFHARKQRKIAAVSVLEGITEPKIPEAQLPAKPKREAPASAAPAPLSPQANKEFIN